MLESVDGNEDQKQNDATSASVTSPKPKYKLPYKKVSVAKQFEFLKTAGALSSKDAKPLTVKEIASVAGSHPNTLSACNPFYIENGFLEKTGNHFTACKEVIAYSDRLKWNDPRAGDKMRAVIENTWFSRCLLPRLQVQQSMSDDKAIGHLADACGASPEHKAQLFMTLDYMELGGLLERDNGCLLYTSPSPRDRTRSRMPSSA